ncbi:hypothetical protein ABK040_004450 [Willaertia magna]
MYPYNNNNNPPMNPEYYQQQQYQQLYQQQGMNFNMQVVPPQQGYQQQPNQQYQQMYPTMQPQYVQQQNSLGQSIITACKTCSFDSDKMKTLTTYSQSQVNPINANNLLTILNFFSFQNDKLKALQQLKKTNNIGQMSCQEACSIISLFSFDSDKMKAITELAPHIYDKQNAELVAKKVSFASDQGKIRKLLLPTTTTQVNMQVVPPQQQVIYQQPQVIQQGYQIPPQQYIMQPVIQQYPNLLGKNIITACSKCSYQSDKLKAITTYSTSQVDPIGGGDLLTILKMFQYQSDKFKALEQLKSTNNIGQMSCKEAASIVALFTSSSADKLKAVTALALNIYDRKQNPEVIVALLSYNSDKEKVRKMLLQ